MENLVVIIESIIQFPCGILIRHVYAALLTMEDEFFLVSTEWTAKVVNSWSHGCLPDAIDMETVLTGRACDRSIRVFRQFIKVTSAYWTVWIANAHSILRKRPVFGTKRCEMLCRKIEGHTILHSTWKMYNSPTFLHNTADRSTRLPTVWAKKSCPSADLAQDIALEETFDSLVFFTLLSEIWWEQLKLFTLLAFLGRFSWCLAWYLTNSQDDRENCIATDSYRRTYQAEIMHRYFLHALPWTVEEAVFLFFDCSST